MTNIYLVFVSVQLDNGREICDELKGKSFSALSILYDKLSEDLKGDTDADEDYLVYSVEDFTDSVNDGDMDIITEYYATCVTIGG